MNDILFEIKNQIYETVILCQQFLKNVNLSTVLFSLGFLYIIFMRKWDFKKILSFFLVLLLLFVLLVRFEMFLTLTQDKETSSLPIAIGRTIFFIVVALVFIYHLIKE